MKPEKPLRLRAIPVVLSLGAWVVGMAGASAAPPTPATSPGGQWPIAVKVVKKGRIQMARGGRHQVVDLAGEVAGCIGKTYDPSTHEEFDGGVTLEVVDETEKGPFIYLLLLASAPPNCNIQGHCGAGGENSTLVWLKIDKKLAVVDRQAFAISECRADRTAEVPTAMEPDDPHFGTIQAKDLPWSGDVLRIEYQEREAAPRHLTYDRRAPNAGLQIQP